ncbi:hypothetical protein A2215_01355 [Candidatus Berkelbacteria bacterium RIFOXYA2_FULL_43_10]|uniref:dolichyl-phosphate beta-glucosyltransferase n=1 Tax=Candidatus Berkelbacteria bacterium RIFOXYA2_FULL_43_10 TaxID=1797472 RepID=A0A1F5E976_9BACT|nr:MAG: hypothetical protein A2215_01355 [Candidatus Berkelbacteria bacterium RIFOXYA2_FULL_43_10]
MSKPHLSIVIPAYKEEKRIHKSLDAIEKFIKTKEYVIEVLVVLDGTPDGTLSAVKKYESRIPNLKIIDRKENKGKGYTVKQGMIEASGEYRLFCDADNSTPIEQVDKLLYWANKYDLVIGSRYIEGGKLARPQSFPRKMGGRVLNLLIRMLAIPGIKDTQCGFKLFSEKAAKEIFPKQTFDRWSFDIELLAIARRSGYKIKEVGITWYDDPHSLVNPIKDGLRMVKDSWTVRKNIIAKRYK